MTGRVLAVASTGGHLDELLEVAPRFVKRGEEVMWVTAPTPQSRSLLQGRSVEWAPQIGARQGVRALSALPRALELIRRQGPVRVVSTGAALSAPYLVAARLMGVEAHYVESATRVDGPSVTGRIAQRLPGMHLYRQAEQWTGGSGAWQRTGSVFDAFEARNQPPVDQLRLVVTLGTEKFPFARAVEMLARAIPDGADVLWQLGNTTPPRTLPGRVQQWLPFSELEREVRAADVVLTHCGVGSVLTALRAQRCPVVIPRLREHGEHVDSHQVELARSLESTGLAIVCDSPENVREAIQRAARRVVISRDYNASPQSLPTVAS